MERLVVVLRRFRLHAHSHKEGFVQLFVAKRLIQGLATALGGMFVPIFIYETSGESFTVLGLLYAVLSLAYVLFLVPGMYVVNHIGFSRVLTIGMVFAVLNTAILFFMNEQNIWYLLGPLVMTFTLFRIFHWVPYHVDFTVFTKGGERGRDVSLMFATIAFMGVIGPILSGFIITHAGYTTLFGVITVLLMAAAVSYAFVPAVHETYEWSYRETVQNIFSPKFRGVLISELASGAESIVALIGWPIFLYTVFNGNVLEVGAVSTVIVGATIVIQLFVGKHIDSKTGSKRKTLQAGSFLYALGWIGKIFVFSAAQVFLIGLYHNVTKIFTRTPYDAILYDMSGDQGHYVDEFTVMREMILHTGRAVTLLAMVVLTLYIPIEWSFLIAAGATLLLNMVNLARS